MTTRPDFPRRICIAPLDVASYYSGLREGFAELGIPCWFFCFKPSAYSRYRPAPDAFWLERCIFFFAGNARLASSALGRMVRTVALLVLRVVAMVCAALRCDVFIFGFSETFFRGFELPLLRWLGRSVICVFNGSDTRPPWMSGIFAAGAGNPDAVAIQREITRQHRRIRRLERWCSALVCHPLSAHFLRRKFFNHLQIGVPSPLVTIAPPPRDPAAPVRLVHAPTRPLQKGSGVFTEIVAHLRAEGKAVEYIELTGRPNDEVLAAIAECDIVLDQAYSDTPFAGFATEAASAAKPVIVGGYGATDVAHFAAGTGIPLGLFVHPDAIETTLRQLVEDASSRAAHGREAQAFLQAQWTPKAVAARYLAILRGNAPPTWLVDPATLTYWQGWGAPESTIRAAIAVCVRDHGGASLGIPHNPRLEQCLCTFNDTRSRSSHASPTAR